MMTGFVLAERQFVTKDICTEVSATLILPSIESR